MSNASQVVIRNVGFGLSGNFSCEVTADAPSFSTALVHVQMQVVGKCATLFLPSSYLGWVDILFECFGYAISMQRSLARAKHVSMCIVCIEHVLRLVGLV